MLVDVYQPAWVLRNSDLQHLSIFVMSILSSWQISSTNDVTKRKLRRGVTISSWGLVQADSNTLLEFLRNPNHLNWRMEWSLSHKQKTFSLWEKILAALSLSHWTLKSPGPIPMDSRENQSFEKSFGSSCLHLWQLQAGVLIGGINIFYFNAQGNQAFLS